MYIIRIQKSSLGISAKKYTFMSDGKTVEFSYIKRKRKHIICVSCMFGCNMECTICRSGKSYYGRLVKEEMINGILKIIENEKIGYDRLLISFMGSGEPLANAYHVMNTIIYLSDNPNIYFSMSISGCEPYLLNMLKNNEFIKEIKPKIQFSLHNANCIKRQKLIPNTSSLSYIFLLLHRYKMDVGGDIEINYVVLDGINDSICDARNLVLLIQRYGYPLKINEYHQVNNKIKESKRKKEFMQELRDLGLEFEYYKTDGVDIGAACGQLQSGEIKE